MWRGLAELTWLEIKIFLREPLGAIGTVLIPVGIFLMLGRAFAGRGAAPSAAALGLLRVNLPVMASIFIAINTVLSLVTIVSIYREGGILKRLRATPLRPHTILSAHVLAKLAFTSATIALLVLAGKRYYPVGMDIPVIGFGVALLMSTLCIMSMGFVIASLVRTARFAQPVGAVILYPMIVVSGLFMPIDAFPPAVQAAARLLPMTAIVSLLQGILLREPWSAHLGDVAAIALVSAACVALSARFFRWE